MARRTRWRRRLKVAAVAVVVFVAGAVRIGMADRQQAVARQGSPGTDA
jgi:hypothetical protein